MEKTFLIILCFLSTSCFASTISLDRAKEMAKGEVSCMDGICVHWDKGIIAPSGNTTYVEVRTENTTTRVYRTGQVYEVVPSVEEERRLNKNGFTRGNIKGHALHRLNYWVNPSK